MTQENNALFDLPSREEIAVVGMSGRFPGADNLAQYWEMVQNGICAIKPISDDQLAEDADQEARQDPNFVAASAVMAEPDGFDADFFGFTPREAEMTDPQHRVMLECAWSALEHAGYNPQAIPGLVGVYGGVAPNSYYNNNVATHGDLLSRFGRYPVLIASEREYAITRIAFKLGLRGPAISLNTACSTSGVAVHLACQSLLSGEIDMALAGGARINVPLHGGYVYRQNGILSPDGLCRTFDADAAGTIMGSGVGFLVLKRLSDAQRDGDTIHALIKGTAINNDGDDKVGYTAPSVSGQTAVICEALAMAEVSPETIQYIEAHGTATALGDPIEVAALTRAYREETAASGYCGIGSVKSNIGHLDAGAGVAGIIKTILALQHEQMPPTVNYSQPNPRIDFANSPFYVNDELRPWQCGEMPRRAGVSSFGLGGTNAHIILEEAPLPDPVPQDTLNVRQAHLLLLSAKNETALEAATQQLGDYLDQNPDTNLGDMAYTLQIGRTDFAQRRALVASSVGEAVELLTSGDSRRVMSATAGSGERPYMFMFPGGGAQYVNMARDLFNQEPLFHDNLQLCIDLLIQDGLDIRPHLFSDSADASLTAPSIALPALFAVEYALAQLWLSWGIQPQAMIGHSMGEYTAACLAGVFSLSDALTLVALRGRLFETLPAGAMASVSLSEVDIQPYLSNGLSVAVINRPDACVVSGSEEGIVTLLKQLADDEIMAARVPIDVAAHSPHVDPILDEFRAFLQSVSFSAPQIPFVSNVTGTWIEDAQATDPDYWVRHLRQTVRFADGLQTLLVDPACILLEVGPGRTLSQYARVHQASTTDTAIINSLRHPKEDVSDVLFLQQAVARLWLSGAIIDWHAYHADGCQQRIPLPTYPFQRQRYWLSPQKTAVVTAPVETVQTPLPTPVSVAETPVMESSIVAVAEPVKTESAERPPSLPRPQRIAAAIGQIFEDLSGIPATDMHPDATFLELGFDSLFLTQANMSLQEEFGIAVTFRQLLEEAPTIASLASYLDAQLPSGAYGESSMDIVAAPEPAPVVQTVPKAPSANGEENGGVGKTGVSSPSASLTTQPQNQAPPEAPKGPWKPINKSSDTLSRRQRQHLAALIERINTKSPRSKELTQENRSHLADPRTVAGFRLRWKDLIYPVVGERSEGCRIWDIDGNEYIDVAMGFGVAMYGHKPPFVMAALREQMEYGIEIGPQTTLAYETAALVSEITGLERVAFCNTGSEAVLATIRVARTVSGKAKVVTFAGDYHGIFDEVLVRSVNLRGQRKSLPVAPGIRPQMVEDMIVLDYGDPASLEVIREHAHELAAVIIEPVQSRHPDLQPREFVRQLRQLTAELDIALVVDEMITGFRIEPGGAQAYYGIQADLAAYGKAVAGGMPIGVVAGCARYMDALDGGFWQYGDDSVPEVGVTWFAGTFVRHPLALAAAKACLTHIKEQGPLLQATLNIRTSRFVKEVNDYCQQNGIPVYLEHFSSLWLITFEGHQPFSSLFYHFLRDNGIHLTEGRAAYISAAHTDEDVDMLIDAFKRTVDGMLAGDFFVGVQRQQAGLTEEYTFPLTDGQREIWLATQQGDAASCAYNLSNYVRLVGKVDVGRLQQAINDVVAAHNALRMTIAADGTTQTIHPVTAFDVPIDDLAGLSNDECKQRLASLRRDQAEIPFDLTNGPLFRTRIVRLSDDEYWLLLTGHHIVYDGWSSGIIMRDIGRRYKGEPLPASIQYEEFVDMQMEAQESPAFARSEAYWRERFETAPPPLGITGDRPHPIRRSYQGGRVEAIIDNDLMDAVRKLGAKNGCTLFTTLLTAYKAWVYRVVYQDDIALGVSSAGQSSVGDGRLVGHGVNLLPIRSTVVGENSFNDYLKEMRGIVLDAFEHQQVSFGRILQQIKIPRTAGRVPLVSVVFNVDPSMGGLAYGSLTVEAGSNARSYENFDIFFNLVLKADRMIIECTYNSDIYDEPTAARWLIQYETLLRTVVTQPDSALNAISLLQKDDYNLLQEWNTTKIELPAEMCLQQQFEKIVEQYPNKTAVTYESERLSYQELNHKANQVAHYLLSQNVQAEQFVGICMERSAEMMIGLLGILKAGAAYLPLDPSYPAERLAYMLADTKAQIILSQQQVSQNGLNFEGQIVYLDSDWEKIATFSSDNPNSMITGDNLAYVIHTSGSTGKPKGVLIPHRNVVNFLETMRQCPGLTATDKLLAVTTLSFDIAVLELFLPLTTGAELVIASREAVADGRLLGETIGQSEITVMQATPASWQMLLDAGWQPDGQMKMLCGGEAMPRKLANELLVNGGELWNMYGPTETTIWSAIHQVTAGEEPILIGGPIGNTQMYILDKHLAPVPIGVTGELYIGGDGVARGYLNRPELTAERFVPFTANDTTSTIYRTGDLARWRQDGHIECLGRVDFQVKVRGFRIELGEIEAVLSQHPTVNQAVVTAKEITVGDKRLIAYPIANEGSILSVAELREYMAGKLPNYMIPGIIIPLTEFPLTPNGKVNRLALPDPDQGRLGTVQEYIAPRNKTERQVAEIWQELLKVEQVGVTDNFFELGGHSLLVTQMISRIYREMGTALSLQNVFEEPTISGIGKRIGSESLPVEPIERVPRDQKLVPSYSQERMWFLTHMDPDQPVYNVPTHMRLQGLLDIEMLEKSIGKLIERHESLRTFFPMVNGQMEQRILPNHRVTLPIIDLRDMPQGQREKVAEEIMDKEFKEVFDLTAEEPLVRVKLLRLQESENILIINMHHIISDGWSVEILIRDLGTIYQGMQEAGDAFEMPEMPVQYSDYAQWQRQQIDTGLVDDQLGYWQEKLAGAPQILELPLDKPRPSRQTFAGKVHRVYLPEDLTTKLRQFNNKEQLTLFMTLLATFQLMLQRYSGQDDFLVGTTVAGRNRADVESLVGCFINSLILRASFAEGMEVCHFLQQVRETALGAFDNQDIPFEKLVEIMQPERNLAINPLIQVLLVLQNVPKSAVTLPPVTGTWSYGTTGTSKFDLSFYIDETEKNLRLSIEYNANLFDSSTIERMAQHYETLLYNLIQASATTKIYQLGVMPNSEKAMILQEWNTTKIELPAEMCLQQQFEKIVEQYPNKTAVTYESERLSYQELNHKANQVAHYLLSQNVQAEQFVGICMERSAEMMIGLLGILKAGAAYLPLDPSYPAERLAYMLADTKAQIILSQQQVSQNGLNFEGQIVYLDSDWEKIATFSSDNPNSMITGDNLAYVIHTSGSTGKPKGVLIPHRNVVNFLETMRQCPGLTATDKLLAVTTLSFDIAVLELFLPLTTGAELVIASREAVADGRLLGETIGQSEITVMQATPASWQMLLDAGWQPDGQMKMLCGGEAMPRKLANELLVNGGELWNMYGPTETTIWSAIHQVTAGEEPILIGGPIGNTQMYILDKHLAPVPIGVTGELYIGGDGVARGYLNRPELTAERFVPFTANDTTSTIYRTGDLARWRQDGHIECLGRVDFQVKVRGFRIELGEIEAVLIREPNVHQAHVLIREYAPGDQRLIGYLIGKTENSPSDRQLRRHLGTFLPDYMIPSAFVWLSHFPTTPNGKLDRKALLAMDSRPQIESKQKEQHVAASDQVERQLIGLWEQLLDIRPISVNDNFFELGGHSLLAARLFAQIEQKFGRRLPLALLFEVQTVAGLADVLRAEEWTPDWTSLVPIQPSGTRPPLYFVHAHGGNVLGYRELADRLGPDQPFYGLQAQGLDGGSAPFETIEAVAAHYVNEMRSLQPYGPYYLGGWCMGGDIALEMAQQIQEQGETVGLLIFVQNSGPGYLTYTNGASSGVRRKLYKVVDRVRQEGSNLHFHPHKGRFISERLRRSSELVKLKVEKATRPLTATLGIDREPSVAYQVDELEAVHDVAHQCYTPQPYCGRVLLFRATIQPVGLKHDDALGWRNLIDGELIVENIPGHRVGMLDEPRVQKVAEQIAYHLARTHAIQ